VLTLVVAAVLAVGTYLVTMRWFRRRGRRTGADAAADW
jgi:hypothetical protein